MPNSDHLRTRTGLTAITLLALAFAATAGAQEAAVHPVDAIAPTRPAQTTDSLQFLGFELGLGVGATRIACTAGCTSATHFSAGPLLVLGRLVRPKVFVGGQVVGSAFDDDAGTELALWAVMPVVKYYPTRLVYIGGGVGYGEADGTIEGDKIRHGIWSAEARVAWTMPWNRAITPFVSFFRALSPLRVDGATAGNRVRAHSFQLGVAFSTPGGILE
jgi:hypothetical protein